MAEQDLVDLPRDVVATLDGTRPTGVASAARRRKVHAGHFAFMRALVQGVEAGLAWERYLPAEGSVGDRRLIRSTIAWIREEFSAGAKREDRFGTARLVRLDVAKIPDTAVKLPSLAEFAEENGLEFESESEQIAAFEAAYGGRSKAMSRRGQLVERQLEALQWLQKLIAQPPRPGDAVVAWLDPGLSRHLEAADIFTLAQLIERINGLGFGWYSGIKALGAGKGARIVAWCREHAATIGMPIGEHVGRPRHKLLTHELAAVVAPSSSEIRPLEKFLVPAALDGSRGVYRRPQEQCLLGATNDHQAILAWLQAKHGLTPEQKKAMLTRRRQRGTGVETGLDWLQSLSNTQRAYRKEAERFLLWAIVQRGKALSSMTNEDCAAYRDFIADPQPRTTWCGARSRERWSPMWRPFEGPLSAAAQRHAITILKNLYGFLVDQNYLMGNPWSAVATPRHMGPKINAGRSLSMAQWEFVNAQLADLPDTSADARLRMAVPLLYATGLRRSEVVASTVDELEWVEYPADKDGGAVSGWMLQVEGKGGKLREVPVPTEVVDELSRYLQGRGLAPDPKADTNKGAFLLGQASDLLERAPGLARRGRQETLPALAVDPKAGIAATTLYDQLKAFFWDCSLALKGQGDEKGAERLMRASTHWLRHSHASHAIAKGMEIQIAQQNLGHASLATTTVYVTTEAKRRLRAVQGFWGKSRA